MTKAEKIQAILDWAFEGCNVSAQNQQHTKTQFEAMSEEAINEKYASQLRRAERLQS